MIDDTTADLDVSPPSRRSRWVRRSGIGLLVAMLGAAALGLLGPRTASRCSTYSPASG